MKEKSTGRKRRIYYLILAVSVLLLTAATVLTVYFVVDGQNQTLQTPDPVPSEPTGPIESVEPTPSIPNDKPVESIPNETPVPEVAKFVNPLENVVVTSGYGFYHNQTLGWYYEHVGVDIAADAGTSVLSIADGTVESISTDELTGTKIVLSHADGLQTVYCFVNAAEGLKAGDSVTAGQVIATVAEATGVEYKDGAHLHLEVLQNGANVNPMEYLTVDEK